VFVITVSRTTAARGSHAGFLRSVGVFALVTGVASGLAGLGVMLLSAHAFGDPEITQRTMLLSTLVLLGLGNLPRVLTAEGEQLTWTDRTFLGWPPVALLLYAAAMYWPLAADFFQLAPLDVTRWAVVAGAAAAGLLACVAIDRLGRRIPRQNGRP
jgi:hypothetical protein